MPRWGVGTHHRLAVSVSTRSSSWINADCARRNPAMRSSSEVLPAPDGPKIAVTRLRISTSISSAKCASGNEMFFSSRSTSFPFPAQQKFAEPDRCEREHHRHAQQAEGMPVFAELHVLKNRERERGGFAGNVAGNHDRCAEFT